MVHGVGDRNQNFIAFKVQVRDIIAKLCNTISLINFRLYSHPDAKEFNRKQQIHLLSGGSEVATNSDRIKPLLKDLSLEITSNETHISLLHATDVGCHNPIVDLSALDLHGSEECRKCVIRFPTNISQQRNPFYCWRRGHLSGKMAFVLKLTLSYNTYLKKWNFDRDVIDLLMTEPMIANFPVFPNFSPNRMDEPCGRQMIVTIRVKNPVKNPNSDTNELTEIQQILSQQLLISKTTVSATGSSAETKFTEVPALLVGMLRDIQNAWKKNSHCTDTLPEHIGLLIIDSDAEELVDELKPQLQQFHSKKVEVEKVTAQNVDSDLFREIGISKENISKGDAFVVLSLDTIIDLGVKPYGGRSN